MRGLLGQAITRTIKALMRCPMKYSEIQFLVKLSPETDLIFCFFMYRLITIQRVPLVGITIDMQLFTKFLKNLAKTVENFKVLMIVCHRMKLSIQQQRISVSDRAAPDIR